MPTPSLPSDQSAYAPRTRLSAGSRATSGRDSPFSHLETAWALTPGVG